MIRAWVMDGQRPLLDHIPRDLPKEIRSQIKSCWDQKCNKRPSFSGNKIMLFSAYFKPCLLRETDRTFCNIFLIAELFLFILLLLNKQKG